MDKKKLYKQNGSYNLVRLKTHLQDEGVLDVETIQDMISAFMNYLSTNNNHFRKLTKFYEHYWPNNNNRRYPWAVL